MKIETRHLFYLLAGLVTAWLIYLSRAVLTPFFLAAIFAYVLNPLISFFTSKLRIPRTVAVTVIFLVLISLFSVLILDIGFKLTEESKELSSEISNLLTVTNSQVLTLPSWFQPVTADVLESVRLFFFGTQRRVINYLPGAFNRTINVLVFLVATFYFLKDGEKFKRSLFRLMPSGLSQEWEEIGQKISRVLGDYLRGQIILVIFMSALTYLGLLIIGVRYALILSIFTGLAEIVPFVGPIVAAGVASFVAFTDNFSRINQSPIIDVLVVIGFYAVLRQLEDLFVIPQVMGRMTKLHPLVVLLAVLLGGHFFGILGYLLAVPITASLKVVFDHKKAL